ncbi:MAG: response regulator [Oscillatoriales cyanobacterium RM2_1_1]|nr:response regulator [Oscillatoriales cyanobacterium SM2_3_0]NJO44996.1 response regulator [Oscillatoriales cyanobacterium RM2_1_1]
MVNDKPRLMIVDDEPDNLDLIYRTFRRQFQVIKANSPAQAIELLETEGEVALVISDQSMPEMTGIELLEKVKARFPKTICILLTGYSEEALEREASALGMAHIFRCISKPWDVEEFKLVVQQAVDAYHSTEPT